MNQAMFDNDVPADLEAHIRRLLAEAGDPAVAPSPEYVSRLRDLVLDRLGPPRGRAHRGRKFAVVAAMAAIAAAAAALVLLLLRPTNAWAQVALAVRERPWVHSRTLGPDGKEYGESWFSVKNGVSAVRHGTIIEYHDTILRTVMKYVTEEQTIYRVPENPELRARNPDFYQQLLDPKGPRESPFLGMDIVGQRRSDAVVDGRPFVEIELTLKVVGADRKQTIRFRVDPNTKLPHSCVFQSIEGPEGTTLFDYPDRGPADIYELGAPRTAKIVDRMPSADLDRVLAGLTAGRVRFDDYRGIMDWGDGSNAKRVWRKGRKWRVESLLGDPKKYPQFPRDADAAWWKNHQGDYTAMVQAICDGEKVYYYQPEGNVYAPDAQRPPKMKLSMTQAINPSDDPFMPWPDMFPEHVGHPSIWQPTDDRDFRVDPKPVDGPAKTIYLRVRDTRFPEEGHPDLYRLWIDPEQSFVALRAEVSVFESMNPPKLAYVETKIIEAVGRSPSGFTYPTRILRKCSNFKSEQVWRYLLEFDVALSDEMFRALAL
jgi:hypothetical protein